MLLEISRAYIPSGIEPAARTLRNHPGAQALLVPDRSRRRVSLRRPPTRPNRGPSVGRGLSFHVGTPHPRLRRPSPPARFENHHGPVEVLEIPVPGPAPGRPPTRPGPGRLYRPPRRRDLGLAARRR